MIRIAINGWLSLFLVLAVLPACTNPTSPTAPASLSPRATICAGRARFVGQVGSFSEPTQYAYWTEPPDSAWAILEASEFVSVDSSAGTPAFHDTVTDLAFFSRTSQGWNLTAESRHISLNDTTALAGYVIDLHVTSDSVLVSWGIGNGIATYYYLKQSS